MDFSIKNDLVIKPEISLAFFPTEVGKHNQDVLTLFNFCQPNLYLLMLGIASNRLGDIPVRILVIYAF